MPTSLSPSPLLWIAKLVLLLTSSLPTMSFSASAHTLIATYEIEGLHNTEQTGVYDQIIDAIQQQGLAIQLKMEPIIRAKHSFRNHKTDCLVPADAPEGFFDFPVISSLPLNMASAYVFTRAGRPAITELKQLKDLKIGAETGMNFGPEFDQYNEQFHFNIERVPDIEHNYKKLLSERIDAFIAYSPDVFIALSEEQVSLLSYSPKQAFISFPDGIVCHDTAENTAFMHAFNLALAKLKSNGELKRILGKSYNHP